MAADEIRERGEPRTDEEVLTYEELARLEQPALETIAARLGELTASMRRRPKTIARRYVISVAKGPIEIKAQQGFPYLSILIENPNAIAGLTLEVGFSAGAGTADSSETQVPRQSGKLIPVRFEAVSIGVSDPTAIPAAGAPVFVVLYDELLPAAAYAFAP